MELTYKLSSSIPEDREDSTKWVKGNEGRFTTNGRHPRDHTRSHVNQCEILKLKKKVTSRKWTTVCVCSPLMPTPAGPGKDSLGARVQK